MNKWFLSEKTTKFKEKVRTKSAKTGISGIFPAFLTGKKFSQKSDSAIFWALSIRIFVQKIQIKPGGVKSRVTHGKFKVTFSFVFAFVLRVIMVSDVCYPTKIKNGGRIYNFEFSLSLHISWFLNKYLFLDPVFCARVSDILD